MVTRLNFSSPPKSPTNTNLALLLSNCISVSTVLEALTKSITASAPNLSVNSAIAFTGSSFFEFIVIFGASGNTGMMAVQFGKKMGAKVIAVSKDNWIKTDFGADYIISDYDKVVEQVKDITQGKMADVVLNSLGVSTWENSFSCVGINGRWVTFGGLTGAEVKLNIQSLYRKQIKLIGSNGSTRKEFNDVIDMSKELKVRVWKRFKLEDAK